MESASDRRHERTPRTPIVCRTQDHSPVAHRRFAAIPSWAQHNRGGPMKRSVALLTAIVTGSGVLLATAPAHATAHGKNGRIAFRRYYNADHTRGDIFTIRPDGTRERQLTHTKRTRLATEPDWSPNGRWIAYQVERGGAPNIKVVKIRRDGTHRTSLSQTCHGQCLDDSQPAWSAN